MASASEPTIVGARTPEELEDLLEDAVVLADEDAIARLFEADAVVVDRGGRTTGLVGYRSDPRTVLQARDVALVLSPTAINVARRSGDRGWRFVVCFVRG